MLAKFSVDQALMKARSHVKNNEIAEAQKLYQAILIDFPKNIRAQKGLASLHKHLQDNVEKKKHTIKHNQSASRYVQSRTIYNCC